MLNMYVIADKNCETTAKQCDHKYNSFSCVYILRNEIWFGVYGNTSIENISKTKSHTKQIIQICNELWYKDNSCTQHNIIKVDKIAHKINVMNFVNTCLVGKMSHDDVIKWKQFPRYWPFVWEFTGHRWIPRTKASDAELGCFLWSASE